MDRRSISVHFDGAVVCETFCSGLIMGSSSDGEFGSDSKVVGISLTFWCECWVANIPKWSEMDRITLCLTCRRTLRGSMY